MKISIIGAGNMGGAIACGLASDSKTCAHDITVIDHRGRNVGRLKAIDKRLNVVTGFDSLSTADIVIVAVKPWAVEYVLKTYADKLTGSSQIIVSVAGGISLSQLAQWTSIDKTLFYLIPNTAVAVKQSMTFVASRNATTEQEALIVDIFSRLGKVELIDETEMAAATSLSSCGIAFAFRYIRAAMEGGVEMGICPDKSKEFVAQTLRGAIELLEANGSHPEAEIDKVTTPGGSTIRGLNEMEHAGFSSAVIKGLKASNIK